VAINTSIHSTSVCSSNKYFNQGLGVRDFFSRGEVRAEKGMLLMQKENVALFQREQLLKRLQDFAKKNFYFGSLPIFNQPKQSFVQRIFSWINGTDPTSQLQNKETLARSLENETIRMKSAVATINKLHEAYQKAAKEMTEAAADAVDYDSAIKCSWSWWR